LRKNFQDFQQIENADTDDHLVRKFTLIIRRK